MARRGRRRSDPGLTTVRLSCIADDAQGEQIEVLWDAEIGASVLRAIRGHASAAARRTAPRFSPPTCGRSAGARRPPPTAICCRRRSAPASGSTPISCCRCARRLRLPRVNLLIADDVGLGKTVEAGLVARELLLRRRIDFIVIAAPPAMTIQWKDELESKFGLYLRHHRSRAHRRAAAPARLLRQSVDAPARASSSPTAC